MKIPISVYNLDDSLLIYRNGSVESLNFPFKPFCLVEKNKFPQLIGNKEIWHKVPEDVDKEYLKIEFNTTKNLMEFKRRHKNNSKYIFNNRYIEQLYISSENFLLDYPHTNDLIVMFFDIEVATKGDGLFPKPITNEVLCIGFSVWKYTADGKKEKICQKICKNTNANLDDKDVLNEYFDDVQKYDPDIIAGYFSDEFDFPYIIERSKIVNANLNKLGRGGREPVISEGDIKIRIPGRIHFDIYKSNSGVIKDQSLFGIKSKSLKELARWYKVKKTTLDNNKWIESELKDVELPEHIKNLVKLLKDDPDLLYAYQDDDVYRTEGVGHVYIRNCITLAEMMKVPLDSIMCMYSSFVPKLVVARSMERLRLINTESNFSRYNIDTGSVAKIGLKYEGAVVGLYKDGYQPATWKLDFKSQYPSCLKTWNLGPDTTFLVSVEEYTGKYNCIVKEKFNWYRIPTYFEKKKYKYDLIVKVRNDIEGFLKKYITELMDERTKIKDEMKVASDNDKAALYAQQLSIKVILNSIYGFLGLKTSIYGDTISATMVTALCRWSIIKCMQRNEEALIETDSVTGNTPVYIRKKDTKELDIIPIEDLHNSNKKRDIYTGNYEIYTRNQWKSINYTKKHKVKKNIHRIKISDGYVDVTKDHSLFTLNKLEISPDKIKENITCIETTINPIIKKFNYGDLIENNEFCWLIGFFIAEGSAYEGKNKYGISKRQISLNGNNLELMKKVEILANKYFSSLALDTRDLIKIHKFKIYNTLKSSKVYKVQGGYNKLIVDWFKEFCYTKNRKDKKVPIFILNGTKKMKESFLKGIMEGDGYTAINYNRKVESLDSKFKSLAAGIKYLWNTLGYKTTCNIRDDKENITTYKKRFSYSNGTFRNINKNLVTKNKIISQEEYVYDVSTNDGTFITALGNIVLHNTDGIIVNKYLDTNEENDWLNNEIKNKFNITDNHMELELEGDGESAYFYLMKNYIKLNHDGNMEIHGSSFKTSRAAKIVDRAVRLGIEYIFNNKPIEEVIKEAYNFKGLDLTHYIERVKMSKDKIEYDDQFDWRLFLAKQVEEKTGQVITKGTQMDYVVTRDKLPQPVFSPYYRSGKNYTFINFVDSVDELNFNYYNSVVDKTLEKFGISRQNYEQVNLFEDEIEKLKKPIKKKKLDTVPKEI